MKFPQLISIGTDEVKSEQIGHVIETLADQAITQRRKHERRWYDNNFFDDGYHFRVISRKTGRVIDTIGKLTGFVERAIPKASIQIRGMSNLLFSADPTPIVYPERVSVSDFTTVAGEVNRVAFEAQLKKNKDIARKRGTWLTTEWENQDLDIKLIDMLLLAAKNSISFLKIYTDEKGKIKTDVRDAFDIIVYGDKRNLKSCPFVIDTEAINIEDVKGDERFDPIMREKLQPDNKYATSEIADAYKRARFGSKIVDEKRSTIILKEGFLKETLTNDNWETVIKKTQNSSNLMDGKSRGDMVMRHAFGAGGVSLLDEYIDYDDYPYGYLRFEPGPLYMTPLIERFIPANKSLDTVMTRLEKWVNTMVVGIYQKHKGENFQVSNFPGGQMVEYEGTPLAQMNVANPTNTPFAVLDRLDKYISEQGTSTAALSEVPQGVKSGVAIESLKASDYANLKIATKMLKVCIKQIAILMMERADKDMIEPQEVEYLEDKEPQYFDVIGKRGYEISQQVNKSLPEGIIPIDRKAKVRIEIEPGMGLTTQGKRDTMQQIITFMIQLADKQLVNAEAIKIIVKKFLETFGYGATQEFMEAMEANPQGAIDDQTLQKMKIALLESAKESGMVGPEADQKLVDSTKLGVLESLKESGVIKNLTQPNGTPANPQSKISETMNYKDAPPDIRRQIERAAGFIPSQQDDWENQQAKLDSVKTKLKAGAGKKTLTA